MSLPAASENAIRKIPALNRLKLKLGVLCVAALIAGTCGAFAQQSYLERFAAHNSSMAALQPALITPLVAPDPRLVQYAKLSFSNQYTSTGTETVNYGNGKGIGVIAGSRFEFDVVPPPYLQHNSPAIDGFGDMATLVKYRIASGNAKHGNFELAAILNHCFATGSHKNGAATDSYGPALAGARAFRRMDVIASVGGTLPTGKIAAQGRLIAWNTVVQAHVARPLWFEVENNATFFFAGSHDGKMQNFITPTAFYVVRRKEWKPAHPFLILDSGMQIATSGFHTYNHNLIGEMRILF